MATLEENIQTVCTLLGDIRTAIGEKISVAGATALDYPQLIRDIDIEHYPDFRQWLVYGNLSPTKYDSLAEILASEDYDTLLDNEVSASYAAFISATIAAAIKASSTYLKEALTSTFNYMFFNSTRDFDEQIDNLVVKNGLIDENNRWRITCSSERADNGYYAYMAFDGGLDDDTFGLNYGERHIWSAMGQNQWVQYEYDTAQSLAFIKVYSIRDNAPTGVKIEGSNDGENYVTLTDVNFDCTQSSVGSNYYEKVICSKKERYKYFKFTIHDSYLPGLCSVGEIEIYTYK